ncbi:hypothetical protein PHLCEN_2v7348 [Hermanssonia centrifuga]|uniref:AMP-dependent synthetase/ligase domain-containing protein n=1 Tax=Hermanssonia centrifuga TaxID=98765 RepID=A0A2R6NWT3_9APHY|nr:hypothetical protein PHLCEN_2v7348 [Hermanssonia centrifuga]
MSVLHTGSRRCLQVEICMSILRPGSAASRRSSTASPLTLSAVEGPLHPPLVSQTLPEYFNRVILANHAERPALICRRERPRPYGGPRSHNLGVEKHLAWNFGEFNVNIKALARGLVGLGVKKGDRVGVIMGNNSAYAMLQWACASIGAILVTLNPAYRLPELVKTLSLVEVSHLFVVPRIRSSDYLSLLANAFPSLRNSAPGAIQEPELPALRHLLVVDNTPSFKEFELELEIIKPAVDFREILLWGEHSSEQRKVEELQGSLHHDDIINLQFTRYLIVSDSGQSFD